MCTHTLPLGGWTEILYVNMSDPEAYCPDTLMEMTVSGSRACTETANDGCNEVYTPTYGIPYSRVCGRLHGYVTGGSGFSFIENSVAIIREDDLELIWAFGATDPQTAPAHQCNCMSPDLDIGTSFFCERRDSPNDLLWDGEMCEEDECCDPNSVTGFQSPRGYFVTEELPPIIPDPSIGSGSGCGCALYGNTIVLLVCSGPHDNGPIDVSISFVELFIQ